MQDLEIKGLVEAERLRQQETISLIASENIVSKDIRAAVGSELTNKYAEGYPNRRYYGGCSVHDQIEKLAIDRAKKLFGAEHANVQPHCGSAANMAAIFSVAKPGETILAMDLDHGGHLTHGSRVNFSGKWFNIVGYGLNPQTEELDYDEILTLAKKYKPVLIIAGASAYSRTIDFSRFRFIADEVCAKLLVDMAHIAGLVAAGCHPSPFPYADIVTSTTHKTLRGPRGGLILSREDLAKKIDSWIFPGLQGGPLMHEIAGKAVCFYEALQPSFKTYQMQVLANAKKLAEVFALNKIKLVSGGTDNHLVLLNLEDSDLSGQDAESALGAIGIIANKNKIPFDKKPATVTSGLRLGTPSITTRGMGTEEAIVLGEIISDCLNKKHSVSSLKTKVVQLAKKFPCP